MRSAPHPGRLECQSCAISMSPCSPNSASTMRVVLPSQRLLRPCVGSCPSVSTSSSVSLSTTGSSPSALQAKSPSQSSDDLANATQHRRHPNRRQEGGTRDDWFTRSTARLSRTHLLQRRHSGIRREVARQTRVRLPGADRQKLWHRWTTPGPTNSGHLQERCVPAGGTV